MDVIGFANNEQTGLAGVEGFYDEWLRTAGTWRSDQLNGPGEPIPSDWGLYLPSPGGRDLVLHLSAPLQYAAEKRLVEALAKYEAKSGSIIIMEAHTGGILAMANWPTFDLNTYDQAEPASWQNPSVGLLYEPGSIFKVVTYGAASGPGDHHAGSTFQRHRRVPGRRPDHPEFAKTQARLSHRLGRACRVAEHGQRRHQHQDGLGSLLPLHQAIRVRQADRDRLEARVGRRGQALRHGAMEPVRPGGQLLRPGHLHHADPDDQRGGCRGERRSLNPAASRGGAHAQRADAPAARGASWSR